MKTKFCIGTNMKRGLYQHYSGKLYNILGISRHSETHEEYVVYQRLYEDYGIWIRPLQMFLETVVHEGKTVKRFTYLKPLFEEAPFVTIKNE